MPDAVDLRADPPDAPDPPDQTDPPDASADEAIDDPDEVVDVLALSFTDDASAEDLDELFDPRPAPEPTPRPNLALPLDLDWGSKLLHEARSVNANGDGPSGSGSEARSSTG